MMGKGDKRTRRGKIFNGSYGKTRPGRPNKKKKKGKR
jgi:30S ribosomal protein S31